MKHELHSIWKTADGWKLQADHGILTFKRKRDAMAMAEAAKKR
jgi:hypothetical protein